MNKNIDDKKAHIYKNHFSGFYISTKQIADDDLYCDFCEDYDELIFIMENKHDTEYLLSFLFKESYSLSEIFEIIDQLKKYYEDNEYFEHRKETFINKIIQYASDLKFYDKTFKFDVTAIFEDFETEEIIKEVNEKLTIEAPNVDLAMEEARHKMVVENFDVNDYFMKIKYNNIEVEDD